MFIETNYRFAALTHSVSFMNSGCTPCGFENMNILSFVSDAEKGEGTMSHGREWNIKT